MYVQTVSFQDTPGIPEKVSQKTDFVLLYLALLVIVDSDVILKIVYEPLLSTL